MFRFFLHCLLSNRKPPIREDGPTRLRVATIGLDVAHCSSWQCVLGGGGEAVFQEKATTPKAYTELFGGTPRSRGAKKTAIQKCAGELAEHLKSGGESGIRTHVTFSSKHAFQACAFSHSAISPETRWDAGQALRPAPDTHVLLTIVGVRCDCRNGSSQLSVPGVRSSASPPARA